MKAKLLQSTVLWTFLSVATLLVGCSDDEDYRDVDGQSPTLELTSDPYDANGAWLEPGWRFDGKNESFATNTNDSSKKVPAGKYTFIFDTHLVQSKLLKK